MELYMVLLSTILAFALVSIGPCVSSPTITANTSTTTPKSCPHPGYKLYPGFNCYKAFPSEGERKTWREAREKCMMDGGDLMVLESQQEKKDVYISLWNSVDFCDIPWVGVYIPHDEDLWMSVKGEPALSTWWYAIYPLKDRSRKCALAVSTTGLLANWDCAATLPFICEIAL